MNLLCYIVSVFCFIVFMLYSKNDFSCFHPWKFGGYHSWYQSFGLQSGVQHIYNNSFT